MENDLVHVDEEVEDEEVDAHDDSESDDDSDISSSEGSIYTGNDIIVCGMQL